MNEKNVVPSWLSAPLSLLAWTAAIFFTIFFYLFGLFFVLPFSLLFDRGTRGLIHGVARIWACSIMAVNPVWRLKVEGRENIEPGRNYVLVANHQSLLDILVVLAGLPLHFKFMAKAELFSIPFIGWHMKLAGYIPLDRSSRESGRKAVFAAREWLRKGVSVLFFPEGTRSPDGQLHPFKMGAFKVAQEEKVPILPIVIDGTGEAVPKKSWSLKKKTNFFLLIGRPIRVDSKDILLEKICGEVREGMAKRLARIRALR